MGLLRPGRGRSAACCSTRAAWRRSECRWASRSCCAQPLPDIDCPLRNSSSSCSTVPPAARCPLFASALTLWSTVRRSRLSSAPEPRDIGSAVWRDFQYALAERTPGVAVGIVWPATQAREQVVLLSATLRTNIGAGLGDQVEAWPVERARRDGSLRVLPASSVVLELRQPSPASAVLQLPVAGTLHSYLRAQLQGQYLVPGNEVIVPLLGEKRVVIVTAVHSQLEPATTAARDQLPALYLIGAATDLQISAGDASTPSREAWSASPIDSNAAANAEVEPDADPDPEPEPEPEPPAELWSEAAPPVVGGLEPQLASVRELLNVALHTPQQMEQLGLRPPTGVLLHGPPGTGKTLIARRLAAECGDEVAFVSIDGAEIVGKYVGESEARLRDIFHAAANTPSTDRSCAANVLPVFATCDHSSCMCSTLDACRWQDHHLCR